MTDEVLNKARLVADDYRKGFGEDLVSVILYGSGVTKEYDPKKSDLNFLIVLSEAGIERLHLAHELVAKWRKKKVSTPLFLTKDYIESSLDTFPIEFLNIKRNYRVIVGEDVLEGISFNRDFVRMQCERELKGKLLLLRERYVETRGKPKVLSELISASLPTFIFVFNGLLYLLGQKIPETKGETVSILSTELNLDGELFASLLQTEAGTPKSSPVEIKDLFRRYLKEIRRLALLMDSDAFGE
jgi:predicted nucleotidyltransferase